MQSLILLLILVMLMKLGVLSPVACAAPSGSEVQAILKQRIDQEKQSVGIVVGVIDAKGRQIISYGKLSQASNQLVDGNTLFEIGSITKVFTTLALAKMVKAGTLQLTEPASALLPTSVKVPTRNGKKIRLIDLATHSSGLPGLPDNIEIKDPENPYADYTVSQLYDFLATYQLPREIGVEYEYSNMGMGLLGHTLSLKAAVDYETLVLTTICQPLKMDSTRIHLMAEQQARFATGYDDSGKAVKYWDIPTLAGAGALRSTVNDLLKFLAANLGFTQSSLSSAIQKTHQIYFQTQDVEVALGWQVLKYDGKRIFWHNGATGGFRSFIGFDLQQQMGVVVLANSARDVNDIGFHLLDHKFPLTKQHQEIAVNPAIYNAYIGRYQLASDFILTVTKEDNKLYVQATNQQKLELFPETEMDFFIKEVDAQVIFVKDQQGKVTQLILHQSGRDIAGKKLD